MAFYGYYGYQHAKLCLALFNGKAQLDHHFIARQFKVAYIVGMMDNGHLVCLIVPYGECSLENGHTF